MISICSEAAPLQTDASLKILHDRLCRPAVRRPLAALFKRWRHVDITVEAPLPRCFEDEPNLPDRIRGAWGWALTDLARRQGSTKPARLPAWSVFFGPPPPLGPLPACRPFVIQTAVLRRRLFIRLRIIGFATMWADEAECGLRMALKAGLAL